MIRVILIRPGSTEFDEQGRIKGNLDIPLSPLGFDQIAHTAEALASESIHHIFRGPGLACQQTAQALVKSTGAKIKNLPKLANLDHGLWQGKRIDEVKQSQPRVYKMWQATPEKVCPPEGETLELARQRVQGVLEKILKKHEEETIAIVVCEPIASLMRCLLQREPLADLWQVQCACGTWEAIDVEPSATTINQ